MLGDFRMRTHSTNAASKPSDRPDHRGSFARAVPSVAVVLFALIAVAGCEPRPAQFWAGSAFSQANSCPENRLEAKPVEGPPPPAELRNDPERVATWRKNNVDGYVSKRYVRVAGCGSAVTYECSGRDENWTCLPSAEAAQEEILKRASVAMSCPEASLHVAQTWASMLSVEGCGNRGVYNWSKERRDWLFTALPAVPQPATPGEK
jgi:hypothetical protein